jgi:glucuronate isomerase
VGDFRQDRALATFLDLLPSENAMPQMVLYNSNPAENYVFATLAGSFHGSRWMDVRDAARAPCNMDRHGVPGAKTGNR